MAFNWVYFVRITLLILLIAAIITACFTLPVEKILKNFLLWVEQDLGPWGPLVLAVAYIPLTVLAVPASVLTLGGGYLFGLPVGFLADSVGATIGAVVAFLLGRTEVSNTSRKRPSSSKSSFRHLIDEDDVEDEHEFEDEDCNTNNNDFDDQLDEEDG